MHMAAELQRILEDLRLGRYLPHCLRAGIQNWESLSTTTEAELIALGFRAGHRRKLQRAVARSLLFSDARPLPTAAELQQRRHNLRRLARRPVNPERLGENCFSLAGAAPSPWPGETNDADCSREELQLGAGLRVAEALRTSSRQFPIAVSGYEVQEREAHLAAEAD
jgi:hypothetical protein